MWCWPLFKENPGREGKAQKSYFPASRVSPIAPTCQSPAKQVVLDSFPRNHKWERHFYDPVDQARGSMLALPVLPLPLGLFSVLVYTSAKGVGWSFFLQVNFKGMISFQEVLQDPRQMKRLRTHWMSVPVARCCCFRWQGALFQGGVQVRLAQACLSWVQMWMIDWLLIAKLEMFCRD